MQLDRIEGNPDEQVAWGSDVAAQMLRRLGVPYVSLNPGASYRGLHDSIVNHLGNERPGILLCLHEDHSVAIAHGYAKATGEPMACVLHSNVGLLHGMMSLFNAWCDRVPMIVLGATGPLDAEKRRPWIDWIHTSRDQGAYIRSIIKWDDQPSSPQALVESMCRAHIATRSAPTAPVYICLDAGLQESRLDKPPEWPDVSRFAPAEPPRPARSAVDRAAALLARAERAVIMFGRGSRRREFWQPRVRLAETLGACVVSDLKQGAVFPTDHPAHHLPPFNVLPKGARELLCEADVILALDWVDLGGALRQAKTTGKVAAKIIAATLDQNLHTGPTWNTRRFRPSTWRWRQPATPLSRICWPRWARIAAASRGKRVRRPESRLRMGRVSPWSTSPRPCARNSTIRKT
jgi:thiamine pyrophosphate-dependent acetolactate synthase large subunit-like protein